MSFDARSMNKNTDVPGHFIAQQLDSCNVSEEERQRLIISFRKVDGVWVEISKYGDVEWWLTGLTSNVTKSNTKLDFGKIPSEFVDVAKAMLFRLLRRGRDGHKRPQGATLVRVFGGMIFFFKHLNHLKIKSLSEVSPFACATYMQACKEHKFRGGKSLTANSLYFRLRHVELIYELSQYTSDAMPQHPWEDTSADQLSGCSKWRENRSSKTPLMPDDIFSKLFQRAWDVVSNATKLLDLRDEVEFANSENIHLHAKYMTIKTSAQLKAQGITGGLEELKRAIVEIRTACYIVIASLSGCRLHELSYLRKSSFYCENLKQGEVIWWMKSKSTKTGAGDTTWMIPPAAVTALEVMERWAKPYQQDLMSEIEKLRVEDPSDPKIAEALEHLDALFVGQSSKHNNVVRTLGSAAMNANLREFASHCGLNWHLSSHQFRRKFANYAARSQFGDLRYLKEHFKHWSMDMTLGYALNDSQEIALYLEIQDEIEEIKASVVETWFDKRQPLSGGYGESLMDWRARDENVVLFKNHSHMIRSISQSTSIRSNGHAWCTADDNLCVGNNLDRTRCSDGCNNAVIGLHHAYIYQGLFAQLQTLENCVDIGEGGRLRVKRDLDRCRSVLHSLGLSPSLS